VSNLHLSDEELSAMIDDPEPGAKAEAMDGVRALAQELEGARMHMARCEVCNKRLELLQGVKDLLASPLPLPSEGARLRALDEALDLLKAEPAPKTAKADKRRGRVLALAASLVLLAGVGLGLGVYAARGSSMHEVATAASRAAQERSVPVRAPKARSQARYGFIAPGSLGSFLDDESLARALAVAVGTTTNSPALSAGASAASQHAVPQAGAAVAAPPSSAGDTADSGVCLGNARAALASPGALVAGYYLSFKETPALAVVFRSSNAPKTRYVAVVLAERGCKVMARLGLR